jgi:hypothetical protein
MRWKVVHVDRVRRFSLDLDEETGRTFVSIPVNLLNGSVSYDEWYEVDAEEFARYVADPSCTEPSLPHRGPHCGDRPRRQICTAHGEASSSRR